MSDRTPVDVLSIARHPVLTFYQVNLPYFLKFRWCFYVAQQFVKGIEAEARSLSNLWKQENPTGSEEELHRFLGSFWSAIGTNPEQLLQHLEEIELFNLRSPHR